MPKTVIRPIRIEGNIAYVTLTQGFEAIIDAADAPLVDGLNWYAKVSKRADGSIRSVYAARQEPCENGKERTVRMHRLIIEVPADMHIDHIDGNGMNNLRQNLRLATCAQNQHNGRIRTDNKSGLKGVFWDKLCGKWRAQIRLSGKSRHLGLFTEIADATAAYAAASAELHGEFGRTT